MNDFFSSLVDRHRGTCDTVKPRSPGRFEMDRNNMGTASNVVDPGQDLTENHQSLRTSRELSADETPSVTKHKSDVVDRKIDSPQATSYDKKNASHQPIVTEDQTLHFESSKLNIKPQFTQFSDADIQANQGALKKDPFTFTTQLDDKQTLPNNNWKKNANQSDEIPQNNKHLKTASNADNVLESELNHRINELLKHLGEDPSSPNRTSNQNDRNRDNNNENSLSISPETVTPVLDSENETQQLTFAPNTKENQDENNFSENKKSASNKNQLEPPSWLADMATQLSQRLQDAETKADPVINVTIGRVEIRAVQTEPPKVTRQTKKPTGVMTLDDYLKRRESRGTK